MIRFPQVNLVRYAMYVLCRCFACSRLTSDVDDEVSSLCKEVEGDNISKSGASYFMLSCLKPRASVTATASGMPASLRVDYMTLTRHACMRCRMPQLRQRMTRVTRDSSALFGIPHRGQHLLANMRSLPKQEAYLILLMVIRAIAVDGD
jgi:hypothetical protein